MFLDSAEAVLSIFGFNRSLYGYVKKNVGSGMRFINNVKETLYQLKQSYEMWL
jgi:hypothetical protein